jgi:quinol-cytochrome oxidoreductase complex cytochrome b subunit
MPSPAAWLRERIPISLSQIREFANEEVPTHLKKWWFCLGGTPAYLFGVQIITGILLAVYYQPSPDTAYQSVARISHDVSFGWFIRSMHKWAATGMVATVILHQMRVFFTGAYRKPRELSWMVGMTLLLLTLGVGFTGYSLVYEQLSYWGATVAANITDQIPLVGGAMKSLLLGGEGYNEVTLSRFFVLHAAVLPAAMIALIGIHIAIIRIQGVTPLRFKDQKEARFAFVPEHLYTEIAAALTLMIVLCTLAIALPAELGPHANPLSTPEVIKPEWFFYATFRWLKLFSGGTALLTMAMLVLTAFTWPFIDARMRRHTRFDLSIGIGVVAVLGIVTLTVWEAAVAH